MFKVINVLKVGTVLSVLVEGESDLLRNGMSLKDEKGNIITVNTIAMTHYSNPEDVRNKTVISVSDCDIKQGDVLSIA